MTVEEARAALVAADARAKRAKELRDAAEGELLRATMLEMADRHPQIEAFEFDAYYEYDDEGGYYWSVSPHVEPYLDLGRETYTTDRGSTYEREVYDGMIDDLHGFGVEAWRALSGAEHDSECSGKFSVEQLRAI